MRAITAEICDWRNGVQSSIYAVPVIAIPLALRCAASAVHASHLPTSHSRRTAPQHGAALSPDRLAAGGASAQLEVKRMFTEKMQALGEAQSAAVLLRSGVVAADKLRRGFSAFIRKESVQIGGA